MRWAILALALLGLSCSSGHSSATPGRFEVEHAGALGAVDLWVVYDRQAGCMLYVTAQSIVVGRCSKQ